jgi:RimJ/RimL family protein N-acetyltransferase
MMNAVWRVHVFHRTENLFLRPAFPEDWRAVFNGIGEESIVRNLATAPWPYEQAHARDWCAKPHNAFLPSFVVVLPDTGVIGSAGLSHDAETQELQLGYWIARSHWGLGYASEAAIGVLNVARALGHERLTASHFVDNPASGKVLRKAGFVPTGEVRGGFSLARGTHEPVACYEADLRISAQQPAQDQGVTQTIATRAA